MRILVDSNVILAALIKDSTVRRILLSRKQTFYFPQFTLKEISKYKHLVIEKSNMAEEEINEVFDAIINSLNFVSKKAAKYYIKKAYKIMEDIDKRDAPILASALAIKADGILTFDEHFKKQEVVKVLSIKDLE